MMGLEPEPYADGYTKLTAKGLLSQQALCCMMHNHGIGNAAWVVRKRYPNTILLAICTKVPCHSAGWASILEF